jgi:hypothetical protein
MPRRFSVAQTCKIKVTFGKIFPLEEASEGHAYIESGQSRGKIFVSNIIITRRHFIEQ